MMLFFEKQFKDRDLIKYVIGLVSVMYGPLLKDRPVKTAFCVIECFTS